MFAIIVVVYSRQPLILTRLARHTISLVLSSWFIDLICQSVYTKLFSKCREELVLEIKKQLGIYKTNDTHCRMALVFQIADNDFHSSFRTVIKDVRRPKKTKGSAISSKGEGKAN
jgi:hypothetical protein